VRPWRGVVAVACGRLEELHEGRCGESRANPARGNTLEGKKAQESYVPVVV
jgi:hypothetical protein